MCGIAGYITRACNNHIANNNKILQKMLAKMVHRGPDESGEYSHEYINLGMRRLIIIDKSKGSQPMLLENDEYAIIFNGEIFNYQELRKNLEKDNIMFRSNSDTEVLLRMYIRHGTDCINRIKGMFAFCIYDKKKKLTWIVRDRFGIKPLYYSITNDFLVFSSSLDSMIASDIINSEIDATSVKLYMLLSFIPTPNTLYRNIFKLRPGHQIVYKENQVTISKYWDINYEHGEKRDECDYEVVEKLLNESINQHSVADQPVGTYLSGGLDSSLITKKYHSSYSKSFKSYTANIKNHETDEDSKYANKVSKNLRINHTNIKIKNEDFLDMLDELIEYMDEPVYDSSIVASYQIALAAKKDGVKVLLAGNGADEIFGGYRRHYWTLRSILGGKLKYLPNWIIKYFPKDGIIKHKILQLKYKNLSYAINFSGVNLSIYQSIVKNISLESVNTILNNYFIDNKDIPFSKNMMLMDIKTYLLDNGLSILDKTTMGASIEGRVPFLDHNVVEYALLNRQKKNTIKNTKSILRDIARNNSLENIAMRKKMGFDQPLKTLLKKQLTLEKIKNRIIAAKPYLNTIIDYQSIEKLFKKKDKENYTENFMNSYCLSTWFIKKYR